MTEPRVTDKEALEAVGEIIRRAGHELRNALSGVAVNVEVVRSRAERQNPAAELTPFAERARQQVGVATALSDGLLALVSSVVAAAAQGTLKSRPAPKSGPTSKDGTANGAKSQTELMIYGDRAATVASDIERLGSLVGVSVEQRGERVILNVLPEGKSHSKD